MPPLLRVAGVCLALLLTCAFAAAEPPEPVSPAAPSTPSTPSTGAAVQEIQVVGVRREMGQVTLSKTEVREMPGAFGDAFRAIEVLPGVTPLVSGIPYFFVRGAPPNNTGYFLDGVRVPLLFHLGIGQSLIHPGLIDHVDLFSSVAPARYGGFAGATLAGHTREPAPTFHGEANLRLFDAGALVEAPFAEGRGSALIAGRYGYPGPMLSLVTKDVALSYWDYQARVAWQLTNQDRISAFAFGSHDALKSRPHSSDPQASRELRERFVSDFQRLDVRYDRALPAGKLRLALTLGYDSQGASPTFLENESLAVRFEIEHQVTSWLSFRGGGHAQLDHYLLDVRQQDATESAVPQSADPPPTNLNPGLYAEWVARLARRVEVSTGLRFDLYGSTRHAEPPHSGQSRTLLPAVDPRLSTRIGLTEGVTYLSMLGLAHQYPSLRVGNIPAPILSIPGFPYQERHLQTAAQVSQGIELRLPGELTLTTSGFFSKFWGLTDLSASCFQDERDSIAPPEPGQSPAPYVCPSNTPVTGRSYGLEVLLRRKFGARLAGMISYTLSRAERQAHFLTPDGTEQVATVASDFDRTHVLNAMMSCHLGRRWRFGSRLLFYTGTPYSRLQGSYAVPPYNAYRDPAFYRVDVRLEKRWPLGEAGSIAFVFEGQNITLSSERTSLGQDCDGHDSGGRLVTTCQESKVGPITIPSLGVEAFF